MTTRPHWIWAGGRSSSTARRRTPGAGRLRRPSSARRCWSSATAPRRSTILQAGRELALPEGSQSYLLRCLAPLAEADGRTDTLEQADALLAPVHTPPGAAWMGGDFAYLSIARAWLAAGEPARARAVLAPLLEVAARVPWVGPLAYASLVDGRAAALLGRAEEARSLLEQAAELADRYGLRRLAAEAAETAAALG